MISYTYVGILFHRTYGAAFLVNYPGGFTKALVVYDLKNPVRILEIDS